MKDKKVLFSETAYLLGIIMLAFGTALMQKADLGMSMVVAPAYILHLKLSPILPFYSFGMSEYVLQAFLLIILSVVMQRMKKSYLLSFLTAVLYGTVLDICVVIVGLLSFDGLIWKIVFYIVGLYFCSLGVALLFHTYLPPEAYELFVKEISAQCNMSISKTKTIYDCCSCIFSIILSLIFFESFVGIKWGTVICALLNGWLIGQHSHFIENRFEFTDALPLRSKF